MANDKHSRNFFKCLSLIVLLFPIFIESESHKFLGSTTNVLLEIAMESLNRTSPSNHTYRSGTLWGGLTSCPPGYILYRLEFDMDPICEENVHCPPEKCLILIRRFENTLSINNHLKQCMIPSKMMYLKSYLPRNVRDLIDADLIDFIENRTLERNVSVLETDNDSEDNPYCAFCENCRVHHTRPIQNQTSIFDFLEIMMKSIDDVAGNFFRHRVAKVIKISRKIERRARAIIYDFTLRVGLTNCFKIQNISRSECTFQVNKPFIECSAKIKASARSSVRPWILENNCTKSDAELFGLHIDDWRQ